MLTFSALTPLGSGRWSPGRRGGRGRGRSVWGCGQTAGGSGPEEAWAPQCPAGTDAWWQCEGPGPRSGGIATKGQAWLWRWHVAARQPQSGGQWREHRSPKQEVPWPCVLRPGGQPPWWLRASRAPGPASPGAELWPRRQRRALWEGRAGRGCRLGRGPMPLTLGCLAAQASSGGRPPGSWEVREQWLQKATVTT